MRISHLVLSLCVALGAQGAPGFAGACRQPMGESAVVSAVVDGETLVLTDGREVRLLGVLAPVAPPNWESSEDWPFALQARQALAHLVEEETVRLKFDARKEDRYGHLLAHVFVGHEDRAIWIQESLIANGLARVAAQPDLSACLVPLLAAEAKAREERRGIWRSLTYQIRDAHSPNRLGYLRHTYQLIEGKVYGIGEGKKLVYINFGEDWRQDFTIVIARKRLPIPEADGLDLSSLPGRRVRVRGWVEWWNGPMIEISHAREIEILETVPSAD